MVENPLARVAIHQGWLTIRGGGRRKLRVKRFVLPFRPYEVSKRSMKRIDTHRKGYLLEPGGLYAEIALVRLLRRSGWDAVWIDAYRNKRWREMPHREKEARFPDEQLRLYKAIRERVGRGGCWDIWAWRGHRHLFIEAKRLGSDRIRQSQVHWLEAAVSLGVPQNSFRVAGWFLEGTD